MIIANSRCKLQECITTGNKTICECQDKLPKSIEILLYVLLFIAIGILVYTIYSAWRDGLFK